MREAGLNSSTVKSTLQGSAVHQVWEDHFRTPRSEQFYEKAFDWIAAHCQCPTPATALDVGCGIGQHSMRLARRGFRVVAADFSPDRVAAARQNIERSGLASAIEVRNEDLVAGLSFADQSFDMVLCWGVLMHIPHNEAAMAELVRVTRQGGKIVISETNQYSLDAAASWLMAKAKMTLHRGNVVRGSWTRYGMEYWTRTEAGELFIRHTRIGRLVGFFREHGCRLRCRVSGQFTEQYTRFQERAPARLLHALNSAWFACGRLPYLACANLLVFERGPCDRQ